MLLKGHGILNVYKPDHRITVELDKDFGDYYRWLIETEDWVKIHPPAHGYHITLTNAKLKHDVNWDKAYKMRGKRVKFVYSAGIWRGGRSKGFTNYYLKIVGDEIDHIKDAIGLVESDAYLGVHITIGSTKGGTQPYWPEMIKLR